MLISAVMPMISLPLGQYGYVINLPQHVVSFAHFLPQLLSELDVLVVRKDSEQSVVHEALSWLPQIL